MKASGCGVSLCVVAFAFYFYNAYPDGNDLLDLEAQAFEGAVSPERNARTAVPHTPVVLCTIHNAD